jgi:hypothetical protein
MAGNMLTDKKRNYLKRESGLTPVEMIVVMAIMGILGFTKK